MSTLYLVATPIGNLKDITIRALEVLKSIDVIACEDTRRTRILLDHIQNNYPNFNREEPPVLISFYDDVEYTKTPEIINLLKEGKSVALVSDAGTPTISDPGFKLARECIKEGIKVESIPGASSILVAISASGLPTDKFLFLGYPPRKPLKRMNFFKEIYTSQENADQLKPTIILFEAPHRLLSTLKELKEVFNDIEIVLAKELTKIHEQFQRGTISQIEEIYKKKTPKGEYVILFNTKEKVK